MCGFDIVINVLLNFDWMGTAFMLFSLITEIVLFVCSKTGGVYYFGFGMGKSEQNILVVVRYISGEVFGPLVCLGLFF